MMTIGKAVPLLQPLEVFVLFLLALVWTHETRCISRGQISDCSWPFVCSAKYHLPQDQQSTLSSEHISVQGAEKYVPQSGGFDFVIPLSDVFLNLHAG